MHAEISSHSTFDHHPSEFHSGQLRAAGILLVVGLLCTASGCQLRNWVANGFKVGPEYLAPPPVAVVEDWIESEDARVIAELPEHPDWWSVFDDPIVNDLIRIATQQNLSLREAGWRVMQARAQRAIAAGNLFPQAQQGFGEYERVLMSENLATPAPLRAFDEWSTGATLAWEVDVWGRFRRAIASSNAEVDASIGDYDAILICLIAEVAIAYTDYRTFQQRLEYARNNVKIQEGSLKLSQDQADLGLTSYTGVSLAKSSVASTQATIPSLEIGLRQSSNQLCTLLGLPTHDLAEMLGEDEIPTVPPEVAIGIPVDLLRRRPDIRASERVVAAQSEQIGIAASDLYPHFSINGEFALDSEKFKNLFSAASSSGSIGPSFHWDLLNYGRIANNVQLQDAALQELIASYQNTVLTANQEVEDALVAFLRNQERVRFLETNVRETQEALNLLTISFEQGLTDFTGVFVMQGVLVGAQDQLASTRGDVVISLISLYKALGGGWEIRCPEFEHHLIANRPPARMDQPPPARPDQPPASMETLPTPVPALPQPDPTSDLPPSQAGPPPVDVEP